MKCQALVPASQVEWESKAAKSHGSTRPAPAVAIFNGLSCQSHFALIKVPLTTSKHHAGCPPWRQQLTPRPIRPIPTTSTTWSRGPRRLLHRRLLLLLLLLPPPPWPPILPRYMCRSTRSASSRRAMPYVPSFHRQLFLVIHATRQQQRHATRRHSNRRSAAGSSS